nr:unnamed protein product [Callosobruchus analis]
MLIRRKIILMVLKKRLW